MQNGELNGSGEYKDKQGGGAGLPLTKVENNEGKKVLTNGMSRVHRILSEDEINQGKTTRWTELEIHGRVKNLSNALWQVSHLSALFLNGNQLTRVPPEISQLTNLTMLDLSHNKLRSLPAELGDMISLCHLYLNHNQLRVLPYELGKLFRIQTLAVNRSQYSMKISKSCRRVLRRKAAAKRVIAKIRRMSLIKWQLTTSITLIDVVVYHPEMDLRFLLFCSTAKENMNLLVSLFGKLRFISKNFSSKFFHIF